MGVYETDDEMYGYEYTEEYVNGKLRFRRTRYLKWETGKLPDWDGAACASVDPDLFFFDTHDNFKAAQAKLVCTNCAIKQKCLNYALEYNMTYGVWGGTTSKERVMLRRLLRV